MIREKNPPKRSKDDTENGMGSGCRYRKRGSTNIDTLDADLDQQDGNQKGERAAQGVGGLF